MWGNGRIVVPINVSQNLGVVQMVQIDLPRGEMRAQLHDPLASAGYTEVVRSPLHSLTLPLLRQWFERDDEGVLFPRSVFVDVLQLPRQGGFRCGVPCIVQASNQVNYLGIRCGCEQISHDGLQTVRLRTWEVLCQAPKGFPRSLQLVVDAQRVLEIEHGLDIMYSDR